MSGKTNMELSITNCVAWCGSLRTEQDWKLWAKGQLALTDDDDLPLLKQIPAMQRRRLSSFAKLSFHCILNVLTDDENEMPCIFASRHGDLHKTSKLIEDVASKEPLSPTHFGLSVHNAVAGLYSIFANNKQPMTATSAGEDSLLMALVDAYAKLTSQNFDRILVVYTDEIVPEKYQPYVEGNEKSLAIAMIVEQKKRDNAISFSFEKQNNIEQSMSFQPLAFLNYFFGDKESTNIQSKRYQWHLSRSVG